METLQQALEHERHIESLNEANLQASAQELAAVYKRRCEFEKQLEETRERISDIYTEMNNADEETDRDSEENNEDSI